MTSEQFKKIGDRIKQVRKEAKLTQTELAELIDTQQSAVSAIEKGEKAPTTRFLSDFSERMGVSINWLWTGKEDQITPSIADSKTDYAAQGLSEAQQEVLEMVKDDPIAVEVLREIYKLPKSEKLNHLARIMKDIEDKKAGK